MSTGPNIALWGISFSNEEYSQHGEGCGGYVGIPTRRHGLVMTGRARCLKCGRWVGRKAWREMSRNLQEGILDWDTMYDKGDNWRVFVRVAPDKRRPGPPSRLRPINAWAEQPVYMPRSKKASKAVNSILGALQDAVDEYRGEDDEVIDCEEV